MTDSQQTAEVIILGVFVADLAFNSPRLPKIGETLIGTGFTMGPGGKGGNQAVAAARCGADTAFITKLGKDSFGDMALTTWAEDGIITLVEQSETDPTGAAFIYINDQTGENAIIIVPGAASTIAADTIDGHAEAIKTAKIFVTQLEQPLEAARRGLEIARKAGTTTIFNPAPAAPFSDDIYSLCDYITPNETEAGDLTGIAVNNIEDARHAADLLLAKGVGSALITLGEKGALFHNQEISEIIPAVSTGDVIDTTGAGDAFNGAFAAALARGDEPLQAVKFANIAAGISVTRPGTAASMPKLAEVTRILS